MLNRPLTREETVALGSLRFGSGLIRNPKVVPLYARLEEQMLVSLIRSGGVWFATLTSAGWSLADG